MLEITWDESLSRNVLNEQIINTGAVPDRHSKRTVTLAQLTPELRRVASEVWTMGEWLVVSPPKDWTDDHLAWAPTQPELVTLDQQRRLRLPNRIVDVHGADDLGWVSEMLHAAHASMPLLRDLYETRLARHLAWVAGKEAREAEERAAHEARIAEKHAHEEQLRAERESRAQAREALLEADHAERSIWVYRHGSDRLKLAIKLMPRAEFVQADMDSVYAEERLAHEHSDHWTLGMDEYHTTRVALRPNEATLHTLEYERARNKDLLRVIPPQPQNKQPITDIELVFVKSDDWAGLVLRGTYTLGSCEYPVHRRVEPRMCNLSDVE